jgi:hypothetical protein
VIDRCIVTTIDPDTGELDTNVLREINNRFDGKIAPNCWVAHEGEIAVGDPVTLSEQSPPAPPRGGWNPRCALRDRLGRPSCDATGCLTMPAWSRCA